MSSFYPVQPIVTIFLSWLVLGQRPSEAYYIGGTAVVVGLMLLLWVKAVEAEGTADNLQDRSRGWCGALESTSSSKSDDAESDISLYAGLGVGETGSRGNTLASSWLLDNEVDASVPSGRFAVG